MNPYLGVKKAPPGPRILNTWHMCMKQNIQEVHISGIRTYFWHHMVIYMNIKNSVNVFCKQFIVSFVAKLTSIGICYGISLRAYGADRFQFSHYSCFIVTKCQGHQHHFLFHQFGRSLTDLLCGRSKALITCVRNDRELFCHLHQSKPLPILKEESTNV